jgi:hypothetical protein
VITEDDYLDFLSRMIRKTAVPSDFLFHFGTRQFLFLGYGLADWNWRLVLKNIGNDFTQDDELADPSGKVTLRQTAGQDEEMSSWAIQYRPTRIEVELWNARGVKIYNEDINKFVAGLKQAG